MAKGTPGTEAEAMGAMWVGSAGLCLDEQLRVLLVLQGKSTEQRRWAIPAGGQLSGETLAECCLREVWEETGYRVAVRRELQVKTGLIVGHPFVLHLFEVVVTGGQRAVHDPDGWIHEVAWCSAAEVEQLSFSFREDKDWVLEHLRSGDAGPGGAIAGKLVRDRIPELMATQGQPARFRVVPPHDLPALLLAKVQEEAAEVVASGGSAAEIADLLEVLEALARCRGYPAVAVSEVRAEKFRSRGGFERGLVLLQGAVANGSGDGAVRRAES